jgi:hypothetical protein
MIDVPSFISWELLFWIPTVNDFLLLLFTYTSCRIYGATWYFNATPDWDEHDKKFATLNRPLMNTYNEAREKILWELAMIAYSGYAVLFTLAFYLCIVDIEQRIAFCWAMTCMMIVKLSQVKDRTKRNSVFPSLAMYGGYAILKTFYY